MATFKDERRYNEPEAFRRDPGADFNDEARAAQIASFLARGGEIRVIPDGVTSDYKSPTQRADDARRAQGGKKGAAARKGTTNKKPVIRFEDYA